jgi:hypothetical protein
MHRRDLDMSEVKLILYVALGIALGEVAKLILEGLI